MDQAHEDDQQTVGLGRRPPRSNLAIVNLGGGEQARSKMAETVKGDLVCYERLGCAYTTYPHPGDAW